MMSDDNELQKTSLAITKIKTPEDRLIEKVAMECKMFFAKDRHGGLAYMRKELGRDISESTYYDYLHRLDTEGSTHIWINDQARIGFVKNHRDMVEQARNMVEYMAGLFQEEYDKGADRDIDTLVKLSTQLGGWNKTLTDLNLGSPIIANIKYMIDNAGKEVERKTIVPITDSF